MILRVWKVLPFGILLLEVRDGQTWKDHVRNCVPCHFPNVDGHFDPSLAIIPIGYDVCCVGSPHELPLCWLVISVQKDGTWHF